MKFSLFDNSESIESFLIDLHKKKNDDKSLKLIKDFKSISKRTINQLSTMKTYQKLIVDFMQISSLSDTSKFVQQLIVFVDGRLNKSIEDSKKRDTRVRRLKEKTLVLNWFKNNRNELKKLFDLHKEIKQIMS